MKKSVTLVELVVVLAIISALAAVVLLSFSIMDSRRIKSETNSLLADISWTREMALSKNQDYTISFDTSTDTYEIRDASNNLVKRRKLSLVDIETAPATMTFHPPFGRIELDPTNVHNIILRRGSTKEAVLDIFEDTGFVRLQQ